MDGVQAANSGHPGLPMAMAPVAYLLFARIMEHNPADPHWPDRDRFVLSAGHGSMLLYSRPAPQRLRPPARRAQELPPVGLADARATPSATASTSRPAWRSPPGPLGQGFANGVGMAMAERFLRAHFGAEVQNHRIFAIVSDGDLMEGIAAEAASLAGKLGLGRLVYLYDDNDISLDGPTDAELRHRGRRQALRGLPLARADGRRRQRPRRARGRDRRRPCARRSARRSSASSRSSAGPSPNKQGTSKAHGSPLGEDEVRLTKEVAGLGSRRSTSSSPTRSASTSTSARAAPRCRPSGSSASRPGATATTSWRPQWDAAWAGKPLPGVREALRGHRLGEGQARHPLGRPEGDGRVRGLRADDGRRRRRPQRVDQDRVPRRPRAHYTQGRPAATSSSACASTAWAASSTAWPATAASCGPTARPSCSSPTTCAARSACRRSWASRTRGSTRTTRSALGEDGPTHQPVEHLAALRAIPDLVVIRPADANETAAAWRTILEDLEGPGGADPLAPGPADPARRRLRRRRARRLRRCAATTTPRWRSSAPAPSCRSPSRPPSC